jgi:hypothetical protein
VRRLEHIREKDLDGYRDPQVLFLEPGGFLSMVEGISPTPQWGSLDWTPFAPQSAWDPQMAFDAFMPSGLNNQMLSHASQESGSSGPTTSEDWEVESIDNE